MGVPGKIDLTSKGNWQDLGEIAKFAIGSKEVSGDPGAEFKGGAGRIGIIGGHVVKFNTHASERRSGPKASDDMRDSCNKLREKLFTLAQDLGIDEKTRAGIRSKLGLNRDGTAPQNAKLLDRKVVVSVINLIGKDSKIRGAGIDVWEKMNLRVEEIKDLASTTVDESGKTVKRDMHFDKIKNMIEGMSGKAAKLDTHFASLQRPDENVIVADEEPLVEEQVVEEQVVEDHAVEEQVVEDHAVEEQVVEEPRGEVLSEEKEVEDVQPEVKPEVAKNISDDVDQVLNVLKSFDAKIYDNNCLNDWFKLQEQSGFGRLSNNHGFNLTDVQADQIIKKQIADGTKFGKALKKQREDPSGFKPGDDKTLDPISKFLAKAIEKYLASGDVTKTLGGGKETNAVKVCKNLLARASEPIGPSFGFATNLSVYISLMNVVPPELTSDEADAIVKYLVDAMTDLGQDLEKVKNGDEKERGDFAQQIEKSYKNSAAGKKCLWDAILRYVGIDPKRMDSGNNGSGEVGKKGGVNQGAGDSKWTKLIEDLRKVKVVGGESDDETKWGVPLKNCIIAICNQIKGENLTDEMADAIIKDQVKEKTRFGNILTTAKDDQRATNAGSYYKDTYLKGLAEKKDLDKGNLSVLRKAVFKYVGGELKDLNIQG